MITMVLILLNFICLEMLLSSIFFIIVFALKLPLIDYFEFFFRRGLLVNNRRFLCFLLYTISFPLWVNTFTYDCLQNRNKNNLIISYVRLILFLVLFFSHKVLNLWVVLELTELLFFIAIIGWGHQTERIEARLSLVFYAIVTSLSLLGACLFVYYDFITTRLTLIDKILNLNVPTTSKNMIFYLLVSLVLKLSIHQVYVWLPSYKVKLPVFSFVASAAILLTLGRYGIWLFVPHICLISRDIFISIILIRCAILRLLTDYYLNILKEIITLLLNNRYMQTLIFIFLYQKLWLYIIQ